MVDPTSMPSLNDLYRTHVLQYQQAPEQMHRGWEYLIDSPWYTAHTSSVTDTLLVTPALMAQAEALLNTPLPQRQRQVYGESFTITEEALEDSVISMDTNSTPVCAKKKSRKVAANFSEYLKNKGLL